MSRFRIATLLLLLFFVVFPVPTAIAGNSLSNTYYIIFTNPRTFDTMHSALNLSKKNYYKNFEECSIEAPKALSLKEKQLLYEHKGCTELPECTRLAKDIKMIRDLKLKVRDLIKFIHDRKNNPDIWLSKSDIGRTALLLHEYHISNNISIINNPMFKKEMYLLDRIPCQ